AGLALAAGLTAHSHDEALAPRGPGWPGVCGFSLVAVSPQKPDESLTMQQKHGLAFAVVSDPGNSIASLCRK
ncbi:MAG: hypothetical protein ACR2MP_28010, partial [Streptosporangiaceae bacterium]